MNGWASEAAGEGTPLEPAGEGAISEAGVVAAFVGEPELVPSYKPSSPLPCARAISTVGPSASAFLRVELIPSRALHKPTRSD